ncbi:MAG: dihydroorotase [Butyrivibrio sp.]|nr:dihydroorotase [Butyrivibrio sp.]
MLLIRGGYLMDPASGTEGKRDIVIREGRVEAILPPGAKTRTTNIDRIINAEDMIVAPGLVDCHVHFRDPGFTYKEDIYTGAMAAKRGGFTTVVMMGNTNPHMDNPDTISEAVKKGMDTGINVLCCGNVTKGMQGKELVDMDALINAGAVLFTDDGVPVMDEELMKEALNMARKRGMVISLHEEDPKYISNNGINAGAVADKLGIKGSPREAEISMVERDIKLAEETGGAIVVQHISAAESVELIRQARKNWVRVFAEATPHHFTLTEEAVLEHGSLAKMNPPLRLESDRQAIIEGIKDGTIEMIATDHAPHSKEEKEREITKAPSGITGLETSLALGIRELVNPGHISLMTLLERMTCGPADVYGLDAGHLWEGDRADIVIFNPKEEWVFDSSVSKASNTPFLGQKLPGKIHYTICGGEIVYSSKS